MTSSVGAMVVGIRGATASTVAATAPLAEPEEVRRYLLTAEVPLPLAPVRSIVWGGWDTLE